MLRIKDLKIVESKKALSLIPEGKILVNTINAFSYNIAQNDELFATALKNGDYLLPDGIGIIKACKWTNALSHPVERIAGWDFFAWEMGRLEKKAEEQGTALCAMFVGSSENVLSLIRERAKTLYPHLRIATYSPPYKKVFSDEDNKNIIEAINKENPDVLWIGMTAPKQEKWTYQHWDELDIHCHVGTIGAVFDFFAGTARRAPVKWQKNGFEWLYRLLQDPKRMWRRYVIGNPEFFIRVHLENWKKGN